MLLRLVGGAEQPALCPLVPCGVRAAASLNAVGGRLAARKEEGKCFECARECTPPGRLFCVDCAAAAVFWLSHWPPAAESQRLLRGRGTAKTTQGGRHREEVGQEHGTTMDLGTVLYVCGVVEAAGLCESLSG